MAVSSRVLTRLCVALAVVAVAAVVWLVGATQRSSVATSVRQAQAAQSMLTAMVDQETGLRGFALNRTDAFLESYRTGERHYRETVNVLRRITPGDDRTTHDLIDHSDATARAWRASAEAAIAVARETGKPPALSDAISRKAMMDGYRRSINELQRRLTANRDAALERATRLSALLVIVLAGAFTLAGWLVFGRRAAARARREEQLGRRRDEQSSFARALQFMDSEEDTHRLVKRHLERSLPDADVVVLQRNNSADRLEAATELCAGSTLDEQLVDAVPRNCLAVRLGQTFESTTDELLECDLCGRHAGALTTCTPLLVQGEVIGSLLVNHPEPLSADSRAALEDTVTQAAPVLANMRNLAIAEQRASTDALTGLPNRRAIADTVRRMLAQAGRTATPLAAVAIDLDHFKRINDHFGHDKGDDALAAAAQTLGGTLRASDFVGRMGGEEFLALLPDTELEGALQAAENLRAAVAGITVAGVDVPITASFGVAVFPEDGPDADHLLRRADRALYAAKDRGRNRVEAAATVETPHVAA